MAAAPQVSEATSELIGKSPKELARQKLAHIVSNTDLISVGTRTDEIRAEPGQILGLLGAAGTGLSRWGFSLLVDVAQRAPVVAVDVQGWLSPVAAWEVGIDPQRFYVVRCPERQQWSQVVAALMAGVPAVYAEVPQGVPDQSLRRLAAIARKEQSSVVFRSLHGALPSGVAHLSVRAHGVVWTGTDRGHGQLAARRLQAVVSGKAMPERWMEVEDGKGPVRVVGRMAAPSPRRAVG